MYFSLKWIVPFVSIRRYATRTDVAPINRKSNTRAKNLIQNPVFLLATYFISLCALCIKVGVVNLDSISFSVLLVCAKVFSESMFLKIVSFCFLILTFSFLIRTLFFVALAMALMNTTSE